MHFDDELDHAYFKNCIAWKTLKMQLGRVLWQIFLLYLQNVVKLQNALASRHMSLVMRKPVLPYANNNGADQLAHPRSLISAFVVRFLDSIIPLVSISKISRIKLASVIEQTIWVLPGQKPEDRFSRDEAYIARYRCFCPWNQCFK